MRIIVWGINYAPELTGIAPFNAGLCDDLRERGHEVAMVTAFPYYPSWSKVPGDRGRLYRTDDMDGVPVHRCWHYVPRRPTALRRIGHELSFGLTSFVRLLRLPAAEVYVVISPPLILGPLAAILGAIKRRPYVFHVQDLQPDAAVGLGMVKPGLFTRLLYGIESLSYRRAAIVSGISQGMLRAFTRKGVPVAKQRLFPNWIRSYGQNAGHVETESERSARARAFREKFGIAEGTFLATYSGNLGRKQGLETLVEAAALLEGEGRNFNTEGTENAEGRRQGLKTTDQETKGAEDRERKTEDRGKTKPEGGERRPEEGGQRTEDGGPAAPAAGDRGRAGREILILIVGAGVMREALEAQIAARRLTNVRLLPLMAEADYHGMLTASDVALILQAPGTGQFFFPSKLLSILAVGTPVLSMADEDSELARAVAEGEFGVNVPVARAPDFAVALAALADQAERLAELREKTRWVERFSGDVVLGEIERELRALVEGK